jgi:hypothetical protein
MIESIHISIIYLIGSGLDHIFISLGPTPPTPPSLSGRVACMWVGTLTRWEPMWQYPVKITIIQVDVTFINPILIDGVRSHAKGVEWHKWLGAYGLGPLYT